MAKIKERRHNKPVIETLINSTALALFSYGTVQVTIGNLTGYLAILFGAGLEFFKYWGRNSSYW